MSHILNSIPITGFDPEGEPEIRLMSDGELLIAFNFMPPSYAEDDAESFDDFDKQLEKAIGIPVLWEDRESFVIKNSTTEIVEKVRVFLESYRSNRRD